MMSDQGDRTCLDDPESPCRYDEGSHGPREIHNHNQAERDEFLATALPVLEGACERHQGNAWCVWHNSFWATKGRACHAMQDWDDFADRLLEMWEGRGRGEVSS